MGSKEYELKSFTDIVNKVPKERLDNFLEDFKAYLLTLYFYKETEKSLNNFESEMVWIDDGKKEVKINIIKKIFTD